MIATLLVMYILLVVTVNGFILRLNDYKLCPSLWQSLLIREDD